MIIHCDDCDNIWGKEKHRGLKEHRGEAKPAGRVKEWQPPHTPFKKQ